MVFEKKKKEEKLTNLIKILLIYIFILNIRQNKKLK